MPGKDRRAAGRSRENSGTKSRWKLLLMAVAVLFSCTAIRVFWHAGNAVAQAPKSGASGGKPKMRVGMGKKKTEPTSDTTQEQGSSEPAPANSDSQLKVMATVNGKDISRQELAGECIRRFGDQVLEDLTKKRLIWQACKNRNISITEQQVNEEVKRTAEKWNITVGKWLETLEQERGVSPQRYRNDIIWPNLALRALAKEKIVVTPEELRQGMEAEYGSKVKARIIVVGKKQKAEEVRAKAVAKPESFGQFAKEYSEDPSAGMMGSIPPVGRFMGDENLEKAAFALKEGDISPIVKVGDQYVILKCEGHLSPSHMDETMRRTAQARMYDRLEDRKLRDVAIELFKELQATAKIAKVIGDEQREREMPGVAAVVNDYQITVRELGEECLTRHGEEVLEGEINRRIFQQELARLKIRIEDADIEREIDRAADSFGVVDKNGKPDRKKWMEQVLQNDGIREEIYVRDVVWPTVALKKLVRENVEVTDEDVQKGVESNYGERVRVQAIVFSNQRVAQKVWQMARDNPTEDFFGQLAQQYSVEPVSRENLGEIPPIRRHSGQPLIEKEAFALKPGELSSVVSMGDKYIVLRCMGHTQPVVKDVDDQARTAIVKDIQEKKLRAAMGVTFERLRAESTIDNYLAGSTQTPRAREKSMFDSQTSSAGDATPNRDAGTPRSASATNPKGASGKNAPSATKPAGEARSATRASSKK